MIDKLINLIKTILENTSTEVTLKRIGGTNWDLCIGSLITIFTIFNEKKIVGFFTINPLLDSDETIREKLKNEIEREPTFPLEKIIDELSEIALEII